MFTFLPLPPRIDLAMREPRMYIPCTRSLKGSPMPGTRLQPSEREFLSALDRVVYGNPFSDEREQIVQRLVPGSSGQEIGPDREKLTHKVEPLLRAYADADKLQRLDAEDRGLVQTACLYV